MVEESTKETEKRTQKSDDKRSKVWHITDFDEIFKLGDDIRKGRKGPLSYTKSLVSLSGNSKPCEVRHLEMMKDLKARPERHLLRSVFEELKNWSGNKQQNHQGYLVTSTGRPAEPDYIAAQVDYIDKNDLKKAMSILHQIGLIERVILNGQIPDESGNYTDESGNQPDDSGNDVDSLLNGKAEGKASNGLTAVEVKEKDNGNGKEKPPRQLSGEKGKENPPQTPTTDPVPSAVEPCGSVALGGEKACKGTEAPRGTVKPPGGRQRAGPVHREGDYERCDVFYAAVIYKILGLPDSGERQREITSFASKAHQCRCALWDLPPPETDKILERGKRQAAKIAKQKKCNRAAVWNRFMDKITNAKLYKSG